eukprot:2264370-Amphidinium_carterae.1
MTISWWRKTLEIRKMSLLSERAMPVSWCSHASDMLPRTVVGCQARPRPGFNLSAMHCSSVWSMHAQVPRVSEVVAASPAVIAAPASPQSPSDNESA